LREREGIRKREERQTLLVFLPHSRPGPARPPARVRSEPRILQHVSACMSSASSVRTRASVRTDQEDQDDLLLLWTQDGFTGPRLRPATSHGFPGAQLCSAFRPALHWTRYPPPPLSVSLLKRPKLARGMCGCPLLCLLLQRLKLACGCLLLCLFAYKTEQIAITWVQLLL
jgi:hypothetical protein